MSNKFKDYHIVIVLKLNNVGPDSEVKITGRGLKDSIFGYVVSEFVKEMDLCEV